MSVVVFNVSISLVVNLVYVVDCCYLVVFCYGWVVEGGVDEIM